MRTKILLWYLVFLLAGCSSPTDQFLFSASVDRSWISGDFWANRLQDWSVTDGKVVCSTTAPNRNLFFLTRSLNGDAFEVDVVGGSVTSAKGGFGLRLGINGRFRDYRDDAVRGQGTDFLLESSGTFRIQTATDTTVFDLAGDYQKYCRFHLTGHPDGVTVEIQAENGVSEAFTWPTRTPMKGGVALVSDYVTDQRFNREPSAWFSEIAFSGPGVDRQPERAFGPILFAQHLLSDKQLKINVQMAPVDGRVALECLLGGEWKTLAEAVIDDASRTALLKTMWEYSADVPYRIRYDYTPYQGPATTQYFEGTIREEPHDKKEIVVAAFTGNNDLGFPNQDIVENVVKQQPDFLFFSGDQIYEGVGGYGVQRSPTDLATLDYLRKWYLFGWTYRDLMRDIPTVSIPDDHDVFHGNIWGASGKATPPGMTGTPAQDQGGYKMPPEFVNMVQRTQTDQLPDPYDPTPVLQDIGVYYTDVNYAGISFAVLEDRKFKSAPTPMLPEAEVWNGWPQNRNYDIQKADIPEAQLLGARQHAFLNEWVHDWSNGTWMKVVLSQTIFANVATLPKEEAHDQNVPKLRILKQAEYATNDRKVTDMDSNGWPQTPRDEALRIIRKGFALHIAGDQHLGSTIQYGVDEYRDAGFAICVPSVSNVWPRRWYPPEKGGNHVEGNPPYTGDYEDGFGNKMTVLAVSNPIFTGRKPANLHDRATGYGIIKLDRSRSITLENWARDTDPTLQGAAPYPGWPVTLHQMDNYKPKPLGYLPYLDMHGIGEPVVQVIHEQRDEIIYTIRLNTTQFHPPVYREGTYTIKVGDIEMQEFPSLNINSPDTITVNFQ